RPSQMLAGSGADRLSSPAYIRKLPNLQLASSRTGVASPCAASIRHPDDTSLHSTRRHASCRDSVSSVPMTPDPLCGIIGIYGISCASKIATGHSIDAFDRFVANHYTKGGHSLCSQIQPEHQNHQPEDDTGNRTETHVPLLPILLGCWCLGLKSRPR